MFVTVADSFFSELGAPGEHRPGSLRSHDNFHHTADYRRLKSRPSPPLSRAISEADTFGSGAPRCDDAQSVKGVHLLDADLAAPRAGPAPIII
ncbi:hypothetical protein EYF80_051789 [Liparis tanakae]|uniref:Uncharacterized protein n=1 Tax=Liparis tanakae TaxID=230148 RepID=A0A4Z2FBA9_9TELE|nr:hypothetical protein EYF80_051789 [Liparis tanakae]